MVNVSSGSLVFKIMLVMEEPNHRPSVKDFEALIKWTSEF